MSAHLTKIGCLIGRHRWMYLISITGDEVIRVCGRCYDPKIATSSPLSRSAHDLVGRCPILTTKSYAPRRDAQSDHQGTISVIWRAQQSMPTP
jgi:hypothetical protein